MSKVQNDTTPTPINYQAEMKKLPNTSSRIRYLHSLGIERKEIAKMVNVRYQHVRNVILMPLKKG